MGTGGSSHPRATSKQHGQHNAWVHARPCLCLMASRKQTYLNPGVDIVLLAESLKLLDLCNLQIGHNYQ